MQIRASVIITTDRRKENTLKSQSELKVKAGKLPKARENAGDQVVIGLGHVSDWLRGWCEFLGPITEQSEVRPMHSWITF